MRDPDAVADLVILTIKAALAPVVERSTIVHDELAAVKAECVGLRDRLVALEAKASVPGPRGPAGKDGRDGRDGRDHVSLATHAADAALGERPN